MVGHGWRYTDDDLPVFYTVWCHVLFRHFGVTCCFHLQGDRICNELQFRPVPARKLSATCMTYTIAVCTVKKNLLMMDRGTVRNM